MNKLVLILLLAAFGLGSLTAEVVVNQGSSSNGQTWRVVTKKKHKRHRARHRRHHRRHHKRTVQNPPTAGQPK
jgi:hypothetical protein